MSAAPVLSEHVVVPSDPESIRWGRLPAAGAAPTAYVRDGGVVLFETVSHEGILPDQGRDPVSFFGRFGVPAAEVLPDAIAIARSGLERDPKLDGPHVVIGPVAVHDARPGDLLCVETLALERRVDYGIVSNRHGRGVLADELPRPGVDGQIPDVVSTFGRVIDEEHAELIEGARRITFPLRTFLGLVGVASAADAEPSSTPPGSNGGNLDIRHLGISSTLFLPVAVDGALLFAGDPHFAQGNGEVALTAFEAPLRASIRVTVARGREARRLAELLAIPYGETSEALIAIGIGATLDEAMRSALRAAITLVTERVGISESLALAYLSAAADFEISQAVNGIRGVHCVIRKADLERAVERG